MATVGCGLEAAEEFEQAGLIRAELLALGAIEPTQQLIQTMLHAAKWRSLERSTSSSSRIICLSMPGSSGRAASEERFAGEEVAGEEVAGEEVAGEEVAAAPPEPDLDGRKVVGPDWGIDHGDGEEGRRCGSGWGGLAIALANGPPPRIEGGLAEPVLEAVAADSQPAGGLADDVLPPELLTNGIRLKSRHKEVSRRKTSRLSWGGKTHFTGRIRYDVGPRSVVVLFMDSLSGSAPQ